MEEKIKQHLKEYEDAAAENLRVYWMNIAAAEALRRLLEPEQEEGMQGSPPSSVPPAPEIIEVENES